MAVKTISLSISELMDPRVITSLYLYGEKSKPSDEILLSNQIIDRNDDIAIKISPTEIKQYMQTYGRFTNASQIKAVQNFFSANLEAGEYLLSDFMNNNTDNRHKYMHMNFKGNDAKEWAVRTYILNTQAYVINPYAKFIVDEKGNKYIENMTLMPMWDNFDFDSDSILTKLGNQILIPDIDPYTIGKTVSIQFPSSEDLKTAYTNPIPYTQNDFENDKARYDREYSMSAVAGLYKPIENIVDDLWNSGVTNFIDKEGRTIIYGSSSQDTVSINSLTGKMLDYYNNNKAKGTVMVGGESGDKLFGTQYDDILYSNDNTEKDDNVSDFLKGEDGFDRYYVGNGDTIFDSDHKGEVYFDGNLLVGGTWDENEQAYIDENNKDIKYTLNNGDLTVKFDNKILNINDYDKAKQSLNINLAEQKGKEIAIVIDTTGSMQDDIDTAKQTARVIAENIFRTNSDQTQYSKISIVTFSNNSIKTIGTYTTISAFQSGINSVFIENGSKEYAMAALLEGMSNFTPDNGLSKEIYLMTDEPGDDNHRKSEVLARARDLKMGMAKMARNSDFNENYDNSVKINIISINSNLDHFKELSDQTGGSFFQPNSLSELEDALFELSNLGTSNSETINGNNKNNTINGKGGDDTLQGGLGSDTYLFDDNFGKDIIIETNPNDKDTNIIKFTNLTTIKDLTFTQTNNDLIINHANKQDSITIKDFYTDENKISFLEFGDGSKLSNTDLKDFAFMQSNKKILHYADANEANLNENLKSTFFMADANTPSNISGAMLNDSLIGSDKNDNIWGGYGDDIIIGLKGNDYLNGGNGNDKYIYSKFDGSDTIIDGGGSDTLVLRGISVDEAKFEKSGKDLVISFTFNDDKITIQNHFKWLFGKPNKIENIIFDKDENLSLSQIDEFIANNKFNSEFETKVFANETPNFDKIANELAFRFGNEMAINSTEFTDFTNSDDLGYITSSQIDKIIEQVNSYSDDKGLGNFAFDDLQNSPNLQIYG